MSLTSHYGVDGIPNIVLIGVPNVEELRKAAEILAYNQIPHWEWTEPDFDYGFTAIATAPIEGRQRLCLAHYKLWKEFASVAQLAEQSSLIGLVEGSSPS